MRKDRPFIVTFIGDVTIFDAFLFILLFIAFLRSLWVAEAGSTTVIAALAIAGILLLIPIILVVTALGYYKLKMWGYWLMVTVNAIFLTTFIVLLIQSEMQSSYVGILTEIIGLLFIVPTKKYFVETTNGGGTENVE